MPVSAVTGTAEVATDTAAYERTAYFALRQEYYFDRCADVKPVAQSHPGTSVVFDKLTEATVEATPTALTELVDLTATALADTTVSVTLAEHGWGTSISAKLRGTSYLDELSRAGTEVGEHGGKTLDNLARNPLLGGTNVAFGGNATSRATVDGTDVLTAANVRQARTFLANESVKRIGGAYKAFIAPSVAYDLTTETGADAWRDPHVHSKPEEIWNGMIGRFEGFDFIETPRLDIPELPTGWLNGGSSNEDVYPTLFLGKQALAKAYSTTLEGNGPTPAFTMAPVTDFLQRFRGVGWYWLGGYGRFREESIYRFETASSLGV
jgi:N4-gp56 family major capsid protein